MAEWLRRLTRNQMGFPRAGSNPAYSEGVLNPGPLCAVREEVNESEHSTETWRRHWEAE